MSFDFDKLMQRQQQSYDEHKIKLPVAEREEAKEEYYVSPKDRANADDGSLINDLVDSVKASNVYKKYMFSAEDKLKEANEIGIELNVSPDIILASKDIDKWRKIREYRNKQMKFAPAGINDFDMKPVYEKFPNLKELIENPNISEEDAAIAMANVEDLTVASGIVESAVERFKVGKDNYTIGEIGKYGFLGGEITEDDRKRIDELRKGVDNAKEASSFFDNPLASVAGGIAEQVWHLGSGAISGAKTAVVGAIAGLYHPAAAAISGGTAFLAGMAGDMFLNSAGRNYYEYKEMKNTDGRQLLSDHEARAFAAIAAGVETGVEFWNYNQVMSLLGLNHKQAIKEIVAKAGGDAALIKAGLKGYLSEQGKKALKAGAAETFGEEGLQDVGDKLVHDAIITLNPDAAAEKYTGAEYVKGYLKASTEAIPAVIGMGAAGGAASTFKGVRKFAKMQAENQVGEMKLAIGLEMLGELRKSVQGSKLFKQSPETYQASVKAAVENTEYKDVYIDTELALETEDGAQVFNQLVKEMGLEQEEVQAIIQNKANLKVPMELYAIIVQEGRMDNFVSFNQEGHSVARKQYFLDVTKNVLESINLKNEEKQAELIDAIIRENFPEDGIEQDIAAACILENPSNPKAAWQRMKRDVEESIASQLGGTLKDLERGMGQGVTDIYVDKETGMEADVSDLKGKEETKNNSASYEHVVFSNNDYWYSKFFSEYGRKPTKREMLEIAREIYVGEGEKWGKEGFEINEETEHYLTINEEFKTLEALEAIKEKVAGLNAAEMTITQGLSPSAYKVYTTLRSVQAAGNKDVQQAARLNAILMARYADRYAENWKAATGEDFTAEDWFTQKFGIEPRAVETAANGVNQPITNTELLLDEEVEVLNLDELSDELKGKTSKEVVEYIKKISNGVQVPTADFKAIVGLPSNSDKYGQRHIVFNNGSYQRKNVLARDKTLANLQKVIAAARVVEVSPNKKANDTNGSAVQKRKNKVENFYRLFVPVRMNDKLYTLLITAEDFNGNVGFEPQEVSIYEITAKKIETARALTGLNPSRTTVSKISIRDILQNVNDVDNNPYINADGTGNYAVFNQTAAERELVAYHNTNAASLTAALESGGLAVPSLAIVKKDADYDEFGDITLVGTKDLVDPKKGVDVYSKDAYTARIPRKEYGKVKAAALKAFYKEWGNRIASIRKDDEYVISDSLEHGNTTYAYEKFIGSVAVEYHYLTSVLGKEIDLPIEDVKYQNKLLCTKGFAAEFEKIHQKYRGMWHTEESRKEAGEYIGKFIDEKIASVKLKTIKEDWETSKLLYVRENGEANINFLREMSNQIDRVKRDAGKVDWSALRSKMHKEYASELEDGEYTKWATAEFEKMAGAPVLKLGRKNVPYTLENIVQYLLKQKGNGKEKTLTFSDGKLASITAKKFKDIADIKESKEQLKDKETVNAQIDENGKLLNAFRTEVTQGMYRVYPRADVWDLYDEANAALAKIAGKAKPTRNDLRKALEATGDFKNLDDDVLDLGLEALAAVKNTATQYFEAKPQRAVGINEFAGAVVPVGTDNALVEKLKAQGLQVEFYDKKEAGSRQAAMQKVQMGNANVLFQTAYHGTPYTFNKFDLGAIGTGEGAQVHGWGLYFAKDKKIATEYRARLSNVDLDEVPIEIAIDGTKYRNEQGAWKNTSTNEQYEMDSAQDRVLQELALYEGDIEKTVISFKDKIRFSVGELQEEYRQAYEFAKSMKDVAYTRDEVGKGSLFEADVPEDDVLLDEEKPLNEQPEKVRKAILEYYKSRPDAYIVPNSIDELDGDTGEQFYKDVMFQMKREGHYDYPRAASELLNSLGIKGITYNGGRDGRCFVVFDDKAISIINRYNQAAGQKAFTANQQALMQAQEMHEAGESREAIYDATGWYLGADGKWRFEIPDNLDKINIDRLPNNGESRWLRTIYDNPALYNAYPWLATVYVHGKLDVSSIRGYVRDGAITINTDNLSSPDKLTYKLQLGRNVYKLVRTRKAWGWETEVFNAKGEEVKGAMAAAMRALYCIQYEGDDNELSILGIRKRGAEYDAEKTSGETKSRFEAKVKEYTDAIALVEKYADKNVVKKLDGFNEEDKNNYKRTLIHEIQHLIQDYENFAMGGSVEQVNEQIKRQILAIEREMNDIHEKGFDYAGALHRYETAVLNGEQSEQIEQLKQSVDKFNDVIPEADRAKLSKLQGRLNRLRKEKYGGEPFDKYQRLHGEQEARAASDKAEISTLIERANGKTYTIAELVAEHGGKIKDKKKLARWQELKESWAGESDVEWDRSMADEKEALEEELAATAAGKAFLEKVEANDQLDFDQWMREDNERDLKRKVLNGINQYNAIIIFNKDIVGGFSMNAAPAVRGQSIIYDDGLKAGMRIMKLFEAADKSTFIHEMGHIALADLKMFAEMENAPEQIKKDWAVIKKWLGYKDGQGALTTEQHEKFAEGFEAYLRTGEAPVRGLRSVFRQFKKWLCEIYSDFMQLGGKPSDEVRAVMARMLATEEEIEAEATMQGIESITNKKAMKFIDESTKAMYERWVYEAKEEAKEKVLKLAMGDVAEQFEAERNAIIEDVCQNITESLKDENIFKAEALVKLSGSTDILPSLGYTEESYNAELKARGGSLEAAVEKEVAEATAELGNVDEASIQAEAEKALGSSEYKARLLAFEIEALERKEEAEKRLDKTIEKALAEIEADLSGKEQKSEDGKQVKSLKQKIADLKYTYRWREAELKLINEMQQAAHKAETQDLKDAHAEKEAELKHKIKEAEYNARWKEAEADLVMRAEAGKAKEALDKLKVKIKENKEGIRLMRDGIVGKSDFYRRAAFMQLSYMPLAQATATAMWQQKERMKNAEANKLMAKGDWQGAKKAKEEQLMFSFFAAESVKMKQDVEKKINRLKKRSDSIAKGTVQLATDERYFYNHLLFVFGVNRRDAIKPHEWDDISSISQMFTRYANNNEVHFIDPETGEIGIPDWIIKAASGKEVYNSQEEAGKKKAVAAHGYNALNKADFDGLADLLGVVYTVGKNAKKLRTVLDAEGNVVDLEEAVRRIVNGVINYTRNAGSDDETGATELSKLEKLAELGGNFLSDLVKPETIFRLNDGGKDGNSMQFIYAPLKRAADRQLEMMADATNKIKQIFAGYDMSGWSKKQYQFGTSILTKERLIALALNWGTELNQRRIMDGYKVSATEVQETLSNLTADDWQMVTAIWELIGSYWAETVAVEERVTGVGLEKQAALPFTIRGRDGKVHNIKGGYYPIKYDVAKSSTAANQQQDDEAKKLMTSNAIFGTHRGFTKKRIDGKVERKVYLKLDVIPSALDDVIHNICYREAVRDVNKIVNHKDFKFVMEAAYGVHTYRNLQQWVRDNWAMEQRSDFMNNAIRFMRKNATMAIMAYRTSTALLNVLNLIPMMCELGEAKAFIAVKEAYKNPVKALKFALGKSVFLRERSNTMDRDMREKLKDVKTGGKAALNAVQAHSFDLIAFTDLMLAVPTWNMVYKETMQELAEKGLGAEVIERQAVDKADAAVRRIFGSGDVKDLAALQRGNELTKALTTLYSYMNTVYNALYFNKKLSQNTGDKTHFIRGVLYWVVLSGVFDALIRSLWADDDDEEALAQKVARSIVNQGLGTVPLARDIFKGIIDYCFTGKVYRGGMFLPFQTIERMDRFVQSVGQYQKGNKDLADVGRDAGRFVTSATGFSDTLMDGFWTTIKFIDNDFDDDIGEYLKAVIFDKKLK